MEQLIQILETVKPGIDYCTEEKLFTTGKLNSIHMISIITAIRDAFGVRIPFTEMVPANFESAEAMFRLIQKIKGN